MNVPGCGGWGSKSCPHSLPPSGVRDMSKPNDPDVNQMTGRELMVHCFGERFTAAVDQWLADHNGKPPHDPPAVPDKHSLPASST